MSPAEPDAERDPARHPPRVLLLPGWLNSDAGHWQSRWEALHGDRRVEQADWEWPRRGDWMARLEEVLLEDARPAVLVAHSLGCHLVAAWAAHSQHIDRVRGALLVAPPDTERPDMPPNLFNWRPIVRERGCPSLRRPCSAATTRTARWRAAAAWPPTGVRRFKRSVRGATSTPSSGLGDWPEGRAMLGVLAGPLG